jgi:hypothetical protein
MGSGHSSRYPRPFSSPRPKQSQYVHNIGCVAPLYHHNRSIYCFVILVSSLWPFPFPGISQFREFLLGLPPCRWFLGGAPVAAFKSLPNQKCKMAVSTPRDSDDKQISATLVWQFKCEATGAPAGAAATKMAANYSHSPTGRKR